MTGRGRLRRAVPPDPPLRRFLGLRPRPPFAASPLVLKLPQRGTPNGLNRAPTPARLGAPPLGEFEDNRAERGFGGAGAGPRKKR